MFAVISQELASQIVSERRTPAAAKNGGEDKTSAAAAPALQAQAGGTSASAAPLRARAVVVAQTLISASAAPSPTPHSQQQGLAPSPTQNDVSDSSGAHSQAYSASADSAAGVKEAATAAAAPHTGSGSGGEALGLSKHAKYAVKVRVDHTSAFTAVAEAAPQSGSGSGGYVPKGKSAGLVKPVEPQPQTAAADPKQGQPKKPVVIPKDYDAFRQQEILKVRALMGISEEQASVNEDFEREMLTLLLDPKDRPPTIYPHVRINGTLDRVYHLRVYQALEEYKIPDMQLSRLARFLMNFPQNLYPITMEGIQKVLSTRKHKYPNSVFNIEIDYAKKMIHIVQHVLIKNKMHIKVFRIPFLLC
jgi:hypothetical protein